MTRTFFSLNPTKIDHFHHLNTRHTFSHAVDGRKGNDSDGDLTEENRRDAGHDCTGNYSEWERSGMLRHSSDKQQQVVLAKQAEFAMRLGQRFEEDKRDVINFSQAQ